MLGAIYSGAMRPEEGPLAKSEDIRNPGEYKVT